MHLVARRAGAADLITYFLAKGLRSDEANKDGNTAFMLAAGSNRELPAIELLQAGVKDINLANSRGQTALSSAVRGNSPEVVKYLLDKGAKADVKDAKGVNLAGYLVEGYSPRSMKDVEAKLAMLRTAGVDLAAPQADGNTLYHLTVATGDLRLLQLVSGMGININAKNQEGITALHKAAMLAKDDAIMKYLISAGAKKEIQTNFNETAFDLASENENFAKQTTTIEFLK